MDYNQLKTPALVFNLDKISNNIEKLSKMLKVFPNIQLCYSTKTNCLKEILEFVSKKRLYHECVSREEYDYLISLGFNPKNIIFNGPIKSIEDLEIAIINDSYINIDSLVEAESLIKLQDILGNYKKLGIRINLDLTKEELKKKIGYEYSRFGVSTESGEFDKIVNLLNKNKINIYGLHFHINSNYDIYETYMYIVNKVVRLIKKGNIKIRNINFGGGILRSVEDYDYLKCCHAILNKFEKNNLNINDYKLFFEPGAAIVANSGELITEVLSVKNISDTQIVTVDATRNYYDSTRKFTDWKHYRLLTNNKETITNQIICGYTCMESDRMLSLNKEYKLEIKDRIIIEKVGAYSIGLSPCFINGFPYIYFVSQNKIIKTVPRLELKTFWSFYG